MTVTVRYHAQLRTQAGVVTEEVSLPEGAGVLGLLQTLAGRRAGLAAHLLLGHEGKRPSLLVFVNDRQADGSHVLSDGDEVILMTPIAGGAA